MELSLIIAKNIIIPPIKTIFQNHPFTKFLKIDFASNGIIEVILSFPSHQERAGIKT